MNNISYKHIYESGKIVKQTPQWIHIHNPEMLLQYDSNYIEFLSMPTKEEFSEAEAYLQNFHQKTGQNHLKFVFPENEMLTKDLIEELVSKKQYDIGFTELYAIKPTQFPSIKTDPDILIQKVETENFEDFLKLEYKQDIEYGEAFAKGKRNAYQQNQKDDSVIQVIAYYKGQPAGALETILAEYTAEIDGLFVLEEFQRKGIATRLQKFVMDCCSDKTVILLADGDDTPKEMYKKQNYTFQGFQYESLKEKF